MGTFKDLGKDADEAIEKAKDKSRDALHKTGDKIEQAAD